MKLEYTNKYAIKYVTNWLKQVAKNLS